MKNIKKLSLGILALCAICTTSCKEDFLDTVPTTAIGDATIFSSLDNLYIALNGIHKEMVSQESGYQCMGGEPGIMMCVDCCADDITWLTNTWMKAAYLGWTCTYSPTSGYNSTIYRLYYQWILNANKILEGVEEFKDVTSEKEKDLYKQIKGEALCIRGWAHFNLVKLYGDRYGGTTYDGIIYRTSSEVGEQARETTNHSYELALKDVQDAAELLKGIKVNDVNHYSEKVAYGILSRIALHMHNYSDAASYADKAITLAKADGHKLMDSSNIYNGFADVTTKTNEALYAAMTPDDMTVYFYSYYAYMSWNFSATAIRQGVKCINADLYDTMSETDLRRAWWDPTGKMDVPTTAYVKNAYQNRKFTARSTSNAVGDVAFMRLAELYLNKAEALARAGDEGTAQTVFTEFQETRDPAYKSQGNTGEALIEEIMNSRRVELWGEGFRLGDLKRLNLPIKRGRNFDISFCTFLEKDADAKGWAWEIPDAETDYNPLCTKNYK